MSPDGFQRRLRRLLFTALLGLGLAWGAAALALGGRGAPGSAMTSGQERPAPKSLEEVVAERPFPEYASFWPLGRRFCRFMAAAIVPEWRAVGDEAGLEAVQGLATEYLRVVYRREARPSLAGDFAAGRCDPPVLSGEFDALSYAFFRSAFEAIERGASPGGDVAAARRALTVRVGRRFFEHVADALALDIPERVADEASFARLRGAIDAVTAFLGEERYFRDGARFRFDVEAERGERRIVQPAAAFLERLGGDGVAYAVFEMGYPVILPSAVYLFHTVGEAQHHSSRTIEELFRRAGLAARETADFDPIGYPPDRVVELWEIRREEGQAHISE